MGLFKRLKGKRPAKTASDEALLFHAMICVAAADGVIEDSEIMSVETFFVSLPEFADKDFRAMFEQSRKLFNRHGGVRESVAALEAITSEAVKKKAFVLSVDVAMASGEVGEDEDAMLEAIQAALDIDDALATKVTEVLGLKYAQ